MKNVKINSNPSNFSIPNQSKLVHNRKMDYTTNEYLSPLKGSQLFEIMSPDLIQNGPWLSSKEAADYLKIGIPTLLNMVSNGKIPHYKLGRLNRYRKDELEALLLKTRRGE